MVKEHSLGIERHGKSLFPLQGALAGMLGTLPMTIVMLILHRLLPQWQKYALPPQEITDEVAKRSNLRRRINKAQLLGATLVSHFGYGSAMGVLYSLLTRVLPLPPIVKGMLFGLVVWGGSYLGLLPAMGFSTWAGKEPVRRNLLMLLAHLVWGSSTGIIADVLEHQSAR
jgi:putative membrane protein